DSALLTYDRVAFESVTLAAERINDVDLDIPIGSQVGYRAGRSKIGKHEAIVIENTQGGFRRNVGCTVRAYGGDESQAHPVDHLLHVLIQHWHLQVSAGLSLLVKRGRQCNAARCALV